MLFCDEVAKHSLPDIIISLQNTQVAKNMDNTNRSSNQMMKKMV
jgi:hypothetical protein